MPSEFQKLVDILIQVFHLHVLEFMITIVVAVFVFALRISCSTSTLPTVCRFMVRGGQVKDLPVVNYQIIRGALDLQGMKKSIAHYNYIIYKE